MNEFWMWLSMGMEHILDRQGYDHILFVTLLVLAFPFKHLSKLLLIITAFTIGHSASLACSVLFKISLNPPVIELWIALSILITVIYQFVTKDREQKKQLVFIYFVTCCFGLIHGLGFSFQLRSLLGHETSIFLPLLYFNLGIELGQLIIVVAVILFSLFLAFVFKCPNPLYKLSLLCLIGIIALKITLERLFLVFASS